MAEGVDASIPANVSNNMLLTAGRAATTINAINENRLFQGRQAAGQALQQSINPDTGEPDFNRAAALVSQNKLLGPYAMEALSNLQAMRGQQIANAGSQRSIQQAKGDLVRTAIGSIGPTATRHDVLGALNVLASTGQIDPAFAAGIAGSMPGDESQLGAWAQNNFQLPALGAGAALAAKSPAPSAVNVGDKVDLVRLPQIGAPEAVGSLDVHLTPEAKAARQPVIVGGKPSTAPTSALVTPTGEPQADNGITGPRGVVQTGFSPTEQAAGAATGTGLAGMGLQIVQRASKVPDNKAILGNMEGLLDGFTPGPQSGFWKQINQVATQYGLAPPGSAPQNKAQAQEEFGKLAFQLAQQQFQAMGGTGTDAKLDSTMHTSPSDLLTKYGNKGIIHLLKGNEDAVRAYSEAWQKWQDAGHGPETLGQFQSQWNRIYDPRVFQSVYMAPEERQSMLKGMTSAEQAQFKSAFKRAHSLGWVQ